MGRFLTSIKSQWFIIGLAISIVLGISFPQVSALNEGSRITTFIVMLVFLGMGFTLPSESLIQGLSKWRIHVYLQLYIFLFIPAFFYFSLYFFRDWVTPELYIGLIALAVLPTTISTCSVFTQISDGDLVLTLFNASLSNILGVFVSPLLLSLFLSEMGRMMPMSVLAGIIIGLMLKMVLPLIIGQILRFVFHTTANRLKRKIGTINNLLILAIIFFTLAKSASTPILRNSALSMVIPVIYLAAVHFLLTVLAIMLARTLNLSGPEKISVLYAAPQKTLAMGVPLLSAYFAREPAILGVAIIPLLFYHPWELFISGILKSSRLVKRWGKEG